MKRKMTIQSDYQSDLKQCMSSINIINNMNNINVKQ